MGFDPFQGMTQVAPDLERQLGRFIPDFEVRETPEAYVFKADLPGVSLDDLEITVTANRLLVSGKREAEKHDERDTFYAYERAYGSFARAFTLPDDADTANVRAEMNNGVLSLTIPKKAEQQPKKVEVKAGQPPKQGQAAQSQPAAQQPQQPPKAKA